MRLTEAPLQPGQPGVKALIPSRDPPVDRWLVEARRIEIEVLGKKLNARAQTCVPSPCLDKKPKFPPVDERILSVQGIAESGTDPDWKIRLGIDRRA